MERGNNYLQYWVNRVPFADKTNNLANRTKKGPYIFMGRDVSWVGARATEGKGWNGFLEGREDAGVGLVLSSDRWISHLGSSPASDRCGLPSSISDGRGTLRSRGLARVRWGVEKKIRVKFCNLYATVISAAL